MCCSENPDIERRQQITILSGIITSTQSAFDPKDELAFIEVGDNSIKIVIEEIFRGKREIVSVKSREFLNMEADARAVAIKSFLSEFGLLHKKVFLCIPRHSVVARILRLPAIDEEEIGKIVRTEALKHVPCTEEEIVSSFRIIEKYADGYSLVLIAIAPLEVVQQALTVLMQSGIVDVAGVAVGAEGLFFWSQTVNKVDLKNNVLVASIDARHMVIIVVAEGKLVFTRGVPYDTVSGQEIVQELLTSIDSYQKESGKSVNKIIITGLPVAGTYQGLLEKELGVPVEVVEQFINMPVALNIKEGAVVSFTDLLGMASRFEEMQVNLLPEDMVYRNRLQTMRKSLAVTAVLVVLILAGCFGLLMKKLNDKAIYLSQINAEVEATVPQIEQAKKMLKHVKIIRDEINKKPLAIDVVAQLHKLTPAGVSLNMIDFERERALTIRGSGASLNDVLKYVSVLKGSPYFFNVRIKNAGNRQEGENGYSDFEITCDLTKESGMITQQSEKI